VVYLPEHFEETRHEILFGLIDRAPLATLFTVQDGIPQADHIPLLIDPNRGEHGTLIGHVARNNSLWRHHQADMDILAVFQVADAYISPNWYPTKAMTHEVVPTWNYAVVHARGPLVVHEDEKWIRGVVGRLTKAMESRQPIPWKMADAPQQYLKDRLAEIAGIEIPLTSLTGKWKASQNRSDCDREGVLNALLESHDAGDRAMTDEMIRVNAPHAHRR
jgi:transcriptional regulator